MEFSLHTTHASGLQLQKHEFINHANARQTDLPGAGTLKPETSVVLRMSDKDDSKKPEFLCPGHNRPYQHPSHSLLPAIRSNTQWAKTQDPVFIPPAGRHDFSPRRHSMPNNAPFPLGHQVQFRNHPGSRSQTVKDQMFAAPGMVNIPKCVSCQGFGCVAVLFRFRTDDQLCIIHDCNIERGAPLSTTEEDMPF
jgi:hypothetical protein